MRHARRLRQQLDEWQQVWRQVEAMLDRLETAQEEDETARRTTDALLAAAGAVERRRLAAGATATPLGDPVVDRVLSTGRDLATGELRTVAEPWGPTARRGRLPGNDELELAVADLAMVAVEPPFTRSGALVTQTVRFLPSAVTADTETDGVVRPVRVPSYPGGGDPIVPAGAVDLAEVGGLFTPADRALATTHQAHADQEPPPFVTSWSQTARARRAALPGLPEKPLHSTADDVGPPLSPVLLSTAGAVVADVLDGSPLRVPTGGHASVVASLARAAAAAAASPGGDAADLRAAADLLDEEGLESDAHDLVAQLRAAADGLGSSPSLLQALAAAADALAGALLAAPLGAPATAAALTERRSGAQALAEALAAMPSGGGLTGLLGTPVEDGALAGELDAVVAGRLAYPDGSLRILRTLEVAFGRWWPTVVRWMVRRGGPAGALERAARRFLQPFVDGLAGLLGAAGTGFAVEGLQLAGRADVNAVLLRTDAPASLAATVTPVVEAGQVAVLQGSRPAAAVVLGVGREGDALALHTLPLRVSLAPADEPDDLPGLVAAGSALGDEVAPLDPAELRTGRARDPRRDGLVAQALALHSGLALLLGRSELDARLGARRLPDPAGPALHEVRWHGEVPALASAFVLHGVPAPWWEQGDGRPLPLLVRPGELVLLRGNVPASGDAPGQVLQTVVEVDRAVWVPGAVADRIDRTRTAFLATDPAVLGGGPGPRLLCAPREDLVLVTTRRSWQQLPLQGPLTLRRDFEGFDLPDLAVGRFLGADLVGRITSGPPRGPEGVDREFELCAATGLLDDWTRYSR